MKNTEENTAEKNAREQLLKLIKEKALVIGERKLSSGKTSNYYIDGKLITLDPEGAYLTGKIILSMLGSAKIDAVGGLTIGADPIASSVSVLSYMTDKPVRAFIVRREKKEHGMKKFVEGNLEKGWRVAIVDDVVTTGGSIIKALEAVEEAGAVVEKIIAVVDRLEGAKEIIEKKGYRLESIFTKNDIVPDAP